jgi:hypothetical protein
MLLRGKSPFLRLIDKKSKEVQCVLVDRLWPAMLTEAKSWTKLHPGRET